MALRRPQTMVEEWKELAVEGEEEEEVLVEVDGVDDDDDDGDGSEKSWVIPTSFLLRSNFAAALRIDTAEVQKA